MVKVMGNRRNDANDLPSFCEVRVGTTQSSLEDELREASLLKDKLRDANLRGVNLWGNNLWGNNLWGNNLWGNNLKMLSAAELRIAYGRVYSLLGAISIEATLRGIDLNGSNLEGTTLIEVKSKGEKDETI